jgi:maltose O-acetyltransferase
VNVAIESNAFIPFHKVDIGNNSGIVLNARIGAVSIGSNVMIGPAVVILSRNHNYARIDIPLKFQGNAEEQPITIEDDVWIGTRVIILPGVHVGKGVIIGAGAVVTKNIPNCSIVAGNPARVVRMRD